jgi:large subunit ribosomal protein L4
MKAKILVINEEFSQGADVGILPESIFGVEVNPEIISRTVTWQLAKRRSGCHKVKTRSEVSATTAKPFKQKGTGRARQGSKVATQMRGGGIVFGPAPRSHAVGLPKKIRRIALRMALSQKQADGKIFLTKSVKLSSIGTSALAKTLASNHIVGALVADGKEQDNSFRLSSRNIPHVTYMDVAGINVYDILLHDSLVLTESALAGLKEFFGNDE